MNVLVTGGSGDIARFVLDLLAKKNHRVIALDRKPLPKGIDVEFRQADLLDPKATIAAVKDVDAVVHLAAIPNILHDPCHDIIRVNMVSTYNVLQAAKVNGIRKLVYGGSDSGTGFGYHEVPHVPLYLPMDTRHPCWPHECYSFTKYFGEIMFMEYSRAFNIPAISIRFMWVLLERDRDDVAGLKSGKGPWFDWLGSYVMPQDVAGVIANALEHEMGVGQSPPFQAFYVHAPRTFLRTPTLEQAERIWGKVPMVKKPEYYEKNPFAPFFDIDDTAKTLGYKPQFELKDYR